MKQADIIYKNNQFYLTGEIDYLNAKMVFQKSLKILTQHQSQWIFDFSELKSSDSTVLALMVEWIKFAKETNKSIQFQALSEKIISLLKIAGMDELVLAPSLTK